MANIVLPFTFGPNTLIRSADVNADFAEILSKYNAGAVQTDVAKTITASHTFSAAQSFPGGLTGFLNVAGTLVSGASGSGTGGSFRAVDDGGTTRWLMGILGSAGARDWTLYDLANNAPRLTVNNGTGAVAIPGALAVTGVVSGAVQAIGQATDFTTTTTTPANTSLAATLGTTQTWRLEFDVALSCNNTGGVALLFSAPAGATGRVQWLGAVGSATALTSSSQTVFTGATWSTFNSSAAPVTVRAVVYVVTAGTGGAFTLQYNSVTNTQTSTVYTGSTLLATRIA